MTSQDISANHNGRGRRGSHGGYIPESRPHLSPLGDVPPPPASYAHTAVVAADGVVSPAAPGPQEPRSSTNLFVRYVPKAVDDKELRELFAPFGAIATSMVMRDINTGESLGTAFVRYEATADAERALQSMNAYPLYGKKLSVQWASCKHDHKTANNDLERKFICKLFLRNVPVTTTTDDLAHLLSQYGTVADVSIHADTQQQQLMAPRGSFDGPISRRSSNTMAAPCDDGAPMYGAVAETQCNGSPVAGDGAVTVRRIAFVSFTEDGAAERALDGVHHTCALPDCDGIPLMGKLIDDRLPSKKQLRQQQQLHQHQQQQQQPQYDPYQRPPYGSSPLLHPAHASQALAVSPSTISAADSWPSQGYPSHPSTPAYSHGNGGCSAFAGGNCAEGYPYGYYAPPPPTAGYAPHSHMHSYHHHFHNHHGQYAPPPLPQSPSTEAATVEGHAVDGAASRRGSGTTNPTTTPTGGCRVRTQRSSSDSATPVSTSPGMSTRVNSVCGQSLTQLSGSPHHHHHSHHHHNSSSMNSNSCGGLVNVRSPIHRAAPVAPLCINGGCGAQGHEAAGRRHSGGDEPSKGSPEVAGSSSTTPVTTSPTAFAATRGHRYSHNPYASTVII